MGCSRVLMLRCQSQRAAPDHHLLDLRSGGLELEDDGTTGTCVGLPGTLPTVHPTHRGYKAKLWNTGKG
jgi:hypothetical protein